MGKSIKKASICFALAFTLVFTMMPFAQTTKAANGDRSPAGAITMPTNRTLALKQGVATKINFGTEYDYDNYYYFQINPTKTGYITVTSDYIQGQSVALCDAGKKLASRGNKSYDDNLFTGSQYAYLKELCYGVTKGKTYYIRVKGASTERAAYDQPLVGSIKWTNSGVTGIGYGTSKSNAVSLQKNKTKSGVILAGNTNHQWYKIKTSKKKVKILFSAKNNCGGIYARVHYKSSGKWYTFKMNAERSDDLYKNQCTITKNTKKTVTYYIDIYPDYKASGAYQLKANAGNASSEKEIWVVSRIESPDSKETISYNGKGLIQKSKDEYYGGEDGECTEIYTKKFYYDKSNRVKTRKDYRRVVVGPWRTYKYTYKKGKLVKIKAKSAASGKNFNTSLKYNKKGKVSTSITENIAGKYKVKYYYNKKKRLIGIKYGHEKRENISYDKKGNVIKVGNYRIKNKYNGNLLIRKTYSYGTVVNIKYKKIRVSKKMVKKIQEQQKELIQSEQFAVTTI